MAERYAAVAETEPIHDPGQVSDVGHGRIVSFFAWKPVPAHAPLEAVHAPDATTPSLSDTT